MKVDRLVSVENFVAKTEKLKLDALIYFKPLMEFLNGRDVCEL
jgi:hypothetical protein